MNKVPEPGTTLGGKYLVDRVLGVGGMGVVVAATHLQLEQKVALKFLLPEALASAEVVARFAREARAAAKIRGEHVARVIDVGAFDDGTPFMVMEYLEGHDLAKELELHGPLPIEDLARYILETCEALAEAHAAKIVHRDLKPSNMFLARQPDQQAIIKVLDFGISKLEDKPTAGLTKTSALMGTAFYMSPEQLTTPKAVDPRSDIWALGVIMYELLTGRQPFAGESVPEIIASILQNQREPLTSLRPNVPPGLVAAIDRCLMFKAADRFANVAQLSAAIAPFATDEARRSVAVVSRVLGEAVAFVPPTPSSAVVRPLAATSVPSAVNATQMLPDPAPSRPEPPSTTAVSSGTVTTRGLSASVAGVPKPTKKPLAVIAAIGVVAVVGLGVGVAMKSRGNDPRTASGLVSPPPETRPSAPQGSAVAIEPPEASPSSAPSPEVSPAPTETAAIATTAVQPAVPKAGLHVPTVVTVKGSPAAATPSAKAVASATPPPTVTAPPAPAPASSASKNPLQMGIK